MRLDHTRGEARSNSLRVGVARPLGTITTTLDESFVGSWVDREAGGGVTLAFDDAARRPTACTWDTRLVLAPGALLVVPPHQRAPWRPSARTPARVLACERAGLADAPTWSDEPQPERLLFGPDTGVEYAHCNDDMVVQQGGLRRIEP
jgi:hypothetical protein